MALVRRLAFVVLPAALAAILASTPGCSTCGKSGGGAGDRPRVVVSIFPIHDLVRRVAGPDADVLLMLPPGRSAHAFRPGPKDAEAASGATLGVMVGLGLDPWMEALVKEAAPKARLLKVGDRVPTLPVTRDPAGASVRNDAGAGDDDERDEGELDPHVWLDPQRAQLIVRAVAEELGRADPRHVLGYRERATAVDASLVALDREAEARTKALARRGFVSFHGGFQYFAERYGLDVLAVIEPSPGEAPPRDHVERVLKVVKDAQVPALFTEPQLDPGPARALAEEARLPIGVLDPLGGGPETDSYEKLIRFDVAQLEARMK